MADSPEKISEESGQAAAEILTIDQSRAAMAELSSESGSPELAVINDFVQHSHEPGEPGLLALEEAINRLADFDPRDSLDAAQSDHLNRVYQNLVRERSTRETEFAVLRDAREVVALSNGESAEGRGDQARRAIEAVTRATPEQVAAIAGSEASQPGEHTLADIRDNFGPVGGQDHKTFEAGFTREGQQLMARELLNIAASNLRNAPEGAIIPDTVMDVVGNHPQFIQEVVGFMGSRVANQDEALRMPFTELAEIAGVTLPDDILQKLDRPRAT